MTFFVSPWTYMKSRLYALHVWFNIWPVYIENMSDQWMQHMHPSNVQGYGCIVFLYNMCLIVTNINIKIGKPVTGEFG